jgi:outer membrane protein OmpA-like peptidoglycan-associated protein
MFLSSSLLYAQSIRAYTKRADELFKEKNYYGAAQLYSIALYGNFDSKDVLPYTPVVHKHGKRPKGAKAIYLLHQLAESYRFYHDYQDALPNYEKYLSLEKKPDFMAYLWYGVSLRAMNEPEKAIEALSKFTTEYTQQDSYTALALKEMADCRFNIEQQLNVKRFAIQKLPSTINDLGSNYAYAKLNDSIFVFSSLKPDTVGKNKDVIYRSALYQYNTNQNTVSKLFQQTLPYDAAAAQFSADGLRVYFTGWNEDQKSEANKYLIYTATRSSVDAPWDRPFALDSFVNAPGYNARHPFITKHGQYLFFASDRPGGLGKYDIWKVSLKSFGIPNAASENLGAAIDTPDDDMFPVFLADSSMLYFSSNGRVGLSGMDIYKSKANIVSNQWNTAENLGLPINSVKDDIYNDSFGNADTSYLTSDRESPCCLEIFRSIKLPPLPELKQPEPIDSSKLNTPDTSAKNNVPVVAIPVNKLDEEAERRKYILDSLNSATIKRFSVNFDFYKAKVRPEDKNSLDTMIQLLKDNPEYNVGIGSFTDCKGKFDLYLGLSKARSLAVKMYLIKHHIAASRINVDFYGEQHLILPCKDDATYDTAQQIVNLRSDIIVTKAKNPKWVPSGKELDIDQILDDITNGLRPFRYIPDEHTTKANNNLKAEGQLLREEKARARAEHFAEIREHKRLKQQQVAEAARLRREEKARAAAERRARLQAAKEARKAAAKEKNAQKNAAPNNPYVSKPVTSNNNNIVVNQALPAHLGNELKQKDRKIATLDSISEIKSRLLLTAINHRSINQVFTVYTTSDSVHVDLYDNGTYDHDSVSIIYNSEIIVYKQELKTDKAISFKVPVEPNEKRNEMIYFAENLGEIPPNSALMVITDDTGKRTEVSISNDLMHNTIIYFVKLKKQ